MAREQNERTQRTDDSLLDRRSYLKLAGAAAATISTGSVAAAQSESRTLDVSDGERIDSHLEGINDGETVVIPNGTYPFGGATISADNVTIEGDGATFVSQGVSRLRIRGNNWEFGGVTFDQRGGSNQAILFPSGSGWRFHSCAWVGSLSAGNYLVYPAVADGGQAELDRCWFGDGVSSDRSESAIKAGSSLHGDLWVRRSYFYQSGAYGVQTIDPPKMRGTLNFDRCYFENCYLSCLRTGNDYGETCTVKNCTIVYDSKAETPAIQGRGVKAFRGVWAFWGPVEVVDTDVTNPFGPALVTSGNHGSPSITVDGGNIDGGVYGNVTTGSDVGSNASTTPPSECVTSASEAADPTQFDTGSDSDSSDDGTPTETSDFPHTISVVSDGSGVVSYEFTVSEQIRKSTARGASKDSEDQIDGGTVAGAVAGGTDSYEFGGQISSFSMDGNATIYFDGSEVSADSLADATTTPDSGTDDDTSEQYEGQLVIDGTDHPRRACTYKFKVEGDVRKSSELGSINAFDTIQDGVVSGRVVDGKDAYEISGNVVGFSMDGKATVGYKDQ